MLKTKPGESLKPPVPSCFCAPLGPGGQRSGVVAERALLVDRHSPEGQGGAAPGPSSCLGLALAMPKAPHPPAPLLWHCCSPTSLKASFPGWSGWASFRVPAAPERALPSQNRPPTFRLRSPQASAPGPTPASTRGSHYVPQVARCPHPLPGPPPALAASGPASLCWPWLLGSARCFRITVATLDPAQSGGDPSTSSGF